MNTDWPEAIFQELICQDNEEDKLDRASGILSFFIDEFVSNKKVLDFGCGEGHLVKIMSSSDNNAELCVGYDIVQSGKLSWENKQENHLLTTNFQKVIENAPYDIVVLYDVLDHCENPEEILNNIKSVCRNGTKVYVRCHPYTSRHGGHLYKDDNRAYLHLHEDKEGIFCNKMDVFEYKNLFKKFSILESNTIYNKPERFFFSDEFKNKIYKFFTKQYDFCFRKIDHFVNKKKVFDAFFFPDGKLANPLFIEEQNNVWTEKDGYIEIKWMISEEDPNGKYVDKLKINSDGYYGRSNNGLLIEGKFSKNEEEETLSKMKYIMSITFVDFILEA